MTNVTESYLVRNSVVRRIAYLTRARGSKSYAGVRSDGIRAPTKTAVPGPGWIALANRPVKICATGLAFVGFGRRPNEDVIALPGG